MGPSSSDGGYSGTGRLNCVSFHPSDNNTYWVGSPGGGLWKTSNNGGSWTVLTDNNAVLGVSDIAISSNYAADNTLYIATGDKDGGSMWSLGGGQSNDNNSVGVLKSTDGGATWNTTGFSATVDQRIIISRLIIDPSDNNTLYAATNVGIYKTTNGGTSWTNLYNPGYYIIDLEFKPGTPSTLYASTKRNNTTNFIYRTTDSGANWTTEASIASSDRIDISVTPANAAYVYAIVANTGGGLHSIQRSTDSGGSYASRYTGSSTKNLLGYYSNASGGTTGQGGYDLAIAVSPTNAETLLVAGVNAHKSTDGGSSWSCSNCWTGSGTYNFGGHPIVHADKHMLRFRSNGDLFETNDGGVYLSTNAGSSWTDKTNGIVNSQLYRIGVSQTVSSEVIAGLQDNGSKLVTSGTWSDVKGGDGMECIIDYTNVNVQYGTYVQGQISRTTNHWGSSTAIEPAGHPGAWVAPYIIDPNANQTIYAGYADVYKTTDRGNNWNKISTMNTGSNLRAMAIAPSNSSYLYVSDPNQLWVTTNGGGAWTERTAGLPVGSNAITYIAVKSDDPLTVWVTMGGYDGNRVYESTNAGASWTNISTGLPSLPVMCVIQNSQNTVETELYVGTDVGIYLKLDAADWVAFNTNLPNVVVNELDIYYDVTPANSKLRAATSGRGLWESDLFAHPSIPPTITSISPESFFFADKGKTLTIVGTNLLGSTAVIGGISGNITSNNGTTIIVDFPAGKYTNNTLTIDNGANPTATTTVTVNTRNTIPVGGGTDFHTTIQSAFDGLNAWKTADAFIAPIIIDIYTGTYSEGTSLNSQLSTDATNNLTIQNHTGDAPVVDATGNNYGFDLSTVDNVTLSGFVIHSADISNIYLQGNACGIQYNKVYTSGSSGILTETGSGNNILNNLVTGNSKYGIHIKSSNTNNIENNTCADNGGNFSPPETTIMEEYFEAGIPGTWSQYGTGANSWTTGFLTGPLASGDGSANYALHSWDLAAIDRSLETNSIDLTTYTTASLEYYIYNSGNWGDIVYIEISTDGGTQAGTWTPVVTHVNDASNSFSGWSTLQSVNLAPTYVGTNISVRFRYKQTNGNTVCIDAVKIKASAPSLTGAGLYVESGTGTTVQNNIFSAKTGDDAYYSLITESGVTITSDFNTYFKNGNANLVNYSGTIRADFVAWPNEGTGDLETDPKFVGANDYHIFSTADSFLGGEWPPFTATSGTWTTDASDSPALDRGNPADAFANEPLSGSIINQGAYGNTVQASKTPSPSCTEPSTQATVSTIIAGVYSINISWAGGDGNNTLVLLHENAAVDTDPTSGITYTANPIYQTGNQIGTGNYVVYNGNGASVNVTGLNPETTYHFAIYEYNSTGDCYLTPAATGNTTTVGIIWEGDDGTDPNDWQTTENWNSNAIPLISENITIPTALANYPLVNDGATVAVCKNVSIQSGASITIAPNGQMTVAEAITNSAGNTGIIINSDATGTGSLIQNSVAGVDATVNTYLGSSFRQWFMVGSPIASAAVATFPTTNNLYNYNESVDDYWTGILYESPTNGWTAFNAGNMSLNTGYLFNYFSTTLNYAGQLNPNTTTNSIGMVYTDNGVTAPNTSDYNDYDGWNFLANPYTAAIDWEDAAINHAAANLDNGIYIYDGTNAQYASWVNGASTNGGTQYIPAGQAYFVKANSGGGNLSIPASAITHNTQPFWRSEDLVQDNYLKLRIEGGGRYDETVIRFNDDATIGHDSNYDAYKLYSHEQNVIQIYTENINRTEFSINTLPHHQIHVIPVKVSNLSQNYSIFAPEFNFTDTKVYLRVHSFDSDFEDYEIEEGKSFRFNTVGNITQRKFELIFEESTSNISELQNKVSIYPNPNDGNFIINISDTKAEYHVEITNALGQIVLSKEMKGQLNNIAISHMPNGVYFVKLRLKNGSIINEKIVIK